MEDLEDARNIGLDETLIYDENGSMVGYRIAPAAQNTPVPLHLDENAEILSFPTIYAGQPRQLKEGIRLTYTDIAKSELRRYDRRACHLPKLFYSFKKSYNEKVYSAYRVAFRKRKAGTRTTTSQIRDQGFVSDLIVQDQAYAVFRNVRGTPAYWQQKTKTVKAMIRQLGKCSLFITFSAAETKWPELLVALMKILKNKIITEDEALDLTHEEKSELIRSDPVTCMTHFRQRFNSLKKNLLNHPNGIFEPYEIVDWFTRLEFQMRGSPHIHGIYWLKDCPVYEDGKFLRKKLYSTQ